MPKESDWENPVLDENFIDRKTEQLISYKIQCFNLKDTCLPWSKIETFARLLIYVAIYQPVHTLPLTSSMHKLVLPIAWSHQLMLTETMNNNVPLLLLLKQFKWSNLVSF